MVIYEHMWSYMAIYMAIAVALATDLRSGTSVFASFKIRTTSEQENARDFESSTRDSFFMHALCTLFIP